MKNKILEAVFVISAILLVLYFLFEIRQILVYLVISGIIALIGKPLVQTLNKIKIGSFHMPKTLSVILTIFTFLTVISLLGMALIPLINEQARSLALLNIDEIESNVSIGRSHIDMWFSSHGLQDFNLFGGKKIKDVIDFSFIPNFLNSMIGAMGGISIGLLTVSFISFFLLKDRELILDYFLSLFPKSNSNNIRLLITSVKLSLSRYLIGLMIQVSILFILYTLLLYISGINNFIIIAMLGALLNLIPYVGPFIGIIMMVILSITGNITEDFNVVILPMITKISVGYMLIQLLDNFVNQPMIFSKTANAHPLEIFLVILIAGTLFGIVGMIVAVPTYTIIRIVLKAFLTDGRSLLRFVSRSI
ncbi:MAG: AI-2E family transporter [Flavobacteriales bacterium]|nr:AI-2E family transporter [Flavobacteriales bacterium]